MRCALILLLVYATGACAQEGKGINAPAKVAGVSGQTRALLIGISQYQQVDALRYADRDAWEFAQFLQANSEWKVPPSNIQLLTNEKAKAGDILTGIAWLEEASKPGDQVVFFFSGHGDVETKADSSKGYLLAHDSPRNNYLTGAIPVALLQRIFSGMIAKGIRVFLVTDACRSGHLAGGTQGVQQTAQAFGNQWQNEVKYLSAQPNELSFEDSTWGGGRGVFSFFLMKGLNGYADLNQDSVVTQFELEQYVGPQVAQATKFKQQPVFMGPDKFTRTVSFIDRKEMDRYARWGGDGSITVVVTRAATGKGHEYTDSSCAAYASLLRELETLRLDSAASLSALRSYEQVAACSPESILQARLRLTAAFLNSVQHVVNQTLMGRELITLGQQQTALHRLGLVLSLNQGKALPNYAHLDNIRRYLTVTQLPLLDDEDYPAFLKRYPVRALLDSALRQEPGAPYLLQAKSIYHFYQGEGQYDSVIRYSLEALKGSPTWMMPMLLIGMSYEKLDRPDSALYWYQQVETLDSAYRQYECAICFYTRLGDLFLGNAQWDHAIRVFEKTLRYRSDYHRGWMGLATAHYKNGDRKKSTHYLRLLDAAERGDIEARLETLQWLLEDRMIGLEDAKKRLLLIRGYSTEMASDTTITSDDYKRILEMETSNIPFMDFMETLIKSTFRVSGWQTSVRMAAEDMVSTPMEFEASYAFIQLLWEEREKPGRLSELYDAIKTIQQKFAHKLGFERKFVLQELEATCLILTDENGEIRRSFRKGTPLSDQQKEGIALLRRLALVRPGTCATFIPMLRSLPDQQDVGLQEFYQLCAGSKEAK
ncbi:MAG: hypothetical protein EOO15_05820 [Chitinophagaceae bacterium]|nr:MAG: hypothetical protein EOO15_05820 [Chitinophagaceae bacterium]